MRQIGLKQIIVDFTQNRELTSFFFLIEMWNIIYVHILLNLLALRPFHQRKMKNHRLTILCLCCGPVLAEYYGRFGCVHRIL